MEKETFNILLVDDVPQNIQISSSVLAKNLDCAISATTNSLETLSLALTESPDLILLDIKMPKLNGLEVCYQLKNTPQISEIPVIFISGKNEDKDIIAGFHAGAVDYVTKPFNNEELLARVKTHLELKRAKDKLKILVSRLQESLELVNILTKGEKSLDKFAQYYQLSPKETEVFKAIFQGRDTKAIAISLTISAGTAKNHLLSIYKKTEVHTKVELINKYNNFFR